jgi:hypothetical protein
LSCQIAAVRRCCPTRVCARRAWAGPPRTTFALADKLSKNLVFLDGNSINSVCQAH